ncbi:MAG: redoxin domain-containing protein [Candidatus Pseudobacter hemicellulosilyticus]|uniref:Redoxin domain-containing protein n=1 Tax=Candidatus Pseudobacter hemicellulosilyticus TaxID=3121375 RepID=A0AAJ5X0F5_9BACT|nr:MAG: redoxin domain-containing protein [Pseudobacter sp.]
MKKYLLYIGAALVVAVVLSLTFWPATPSYEGLPPGIDQVPAVKMLQADSQTIKVTDYVKGAPTIFFYFDEDCHTCQQETQSIIDSMQYLKEVRFFLLSLNSLPRIERFKSRYHLADYPNVVVGKDHTYSIASLFKLDGIPAMVVYDRKGQITKIYEGGATATELLKQLN